MAPAQKWDANVHEDVLIAVLEGVGLGKEHWLAIMSKLHEQGYGFTEGALRQHVAKLRKNREGTASGPGTPTKTPAPKKATGKRAAAGSGRKKTATKSSDSQDDDPPLEFKNEYKDEEFDVGDMIVDTPSKRIKSDDHGLGEQLRDDEI